MKEIRLCDDCAFEETIDKCIKNKVGIEVQTFHDLVKKSEETVDDFNKRIELEITKEKLILDKIDCGKSLHAPFWEMNTGSKIPEIVFITKKYYEMAYEIARKLNCAQMVVHNGYFPGTSYEPNWIKRSVSFWKDFLKDKGNDITICLENQFELDSDMIIAIIDEVNDNRLKVCLDIGHAHANSNMSVEKWIETLKDKIVYYHLHNNHGKQDLKGKNNDEHLGLNYGTINISSVLEYAEKYSPNAICSIESQIQYHLEDLEILKEKL